MPQTTPTAGFTEGYRAFGDDVRAWAAPGDDLAQLASRLRTAASAVETQAAVHRGLLALDWQGRAATAFVGLVAVRVLRLERLAGELADLADGAARRAAAGDVLRAAAGWPS